MNLKIGIDLDGVVFDSDIKAECQETVNKARSVLTALALAKEAK